MMIIRLVASSGTRGPMKKAATIRMPISEAKIEISRDRGTFPFSTESETFFSVASSVLESLSWPSAIWSTAGPS